MVDVSFTFVTRIRFSDMQLSDYNFTKNRAAECYIDINFTIISRSFHFQVLYLCKMPDLFRLVSRSLEIVFVVTVVVVPDLFIPGERYNGNFYMGRRYLREEGEKK